MKSAIPLCAASLSLLALAGCGPNAQEIGYAIWMVGPVCWLVMSIGAGIVHRLEGRAHAKRASRCLPLLTALLATLGVALAGYLLGGDDSVKVLGIAIVTAGPSSLTCGLIAYTMIERLGTKWPFGAFLWPALVLYLWLPALALIMSSELGVELTKDNAQSAALVWWGLPGAYGVLPLILLVGLGWRARRRLVRERAYAADEVGEVMS